MKPTSMTRFVLSLALTFALAQQTTWAIQHKSDQADSEASLRANGWLPITSLGFTWWLARDDLQNLGSAFVFLNPRYFNSENLLKIFKHLAQSSTLPAQLDIAVLGDQEVLREELRRLPHIRALGIFDFRDNEKGREARRKFLDADQTVTTNCLRAFYQRSREGKEWFKYTSDPARERYIWFNLDGGSPRQDRRKELIQAVEQGDIDSIEKLVKAGVSLNIESPTGHTLLMFQPKAHKEATVDLLVRIGERMEARDTYGRTPLMHASEGGDHEVVKALLDRGADANARGLAGKTALVLAASKEFPAVVEVLAQKSDVNAADKSGTTALMWAAQNGDVRSIKALLEKGADPNVGDNQGATALFYAGSEPVSVLDVLLAGGAQIDARDRDGWTPLMRAALLYDPAQVRNLIERRANVLLRNRQGESALEIAKGAWGPASRVTRLLESAVSPR